MRKNVLFTLLLCCLFLAFAGKAAFAAAPSNACGTGTDDSGKTTYLTWSLSGGTLTISGQGAMENYSYKQDVVTGGHPSWYSQRSSITKIVVEEGCTMIGTSAFWGCTNLTEVSLPTTLLGINEYAFNGCTKLTYIKIPDSTTYIEEYAFNGCTALTEVYLGDGMTAVRNKSGSSTNLNWYYGPFNDCSAIKKLNVPASGALLSDASLLGNRPNDVHLTELTVRCSKSTWNTLITDYKLQAKMIFADTIKLNDGALNPTTDMILTSTRYDLYGDGNMVIKADSLAVLTYGTTKKYLPYIKTLTIPCTVTKVGDNYTSTLTALTTVIFQGTKAEWKAITIGSGNEPLENATIQYHVHTAGAEQIIAPTCTGQGYTTCYCTTCGRECINRENYTDATGHLHTSSATVLSPTCVRTGMSHITCSDCKSSWVEVIPIDPEGHSTTTLVKVESTCAKAGYMAVACLFCNKEISERTVLGRPPHTYMDAGQYSDGSSRKVCSTCNRSNMYDYETQIYYADMVEGENNLAEVRWMDDCYVSEVEVFCSTDGGATWKVAKVTGQGEECARIAVERGKHYQVKVCYKWPYTYEGTTGVDYSVESEIMDFKSPTGTVIVKITGITNESGKQEVSWSSTAKKAGANNVKYTLLEDASKDTTPKTTVTTTTGTSATCSKNNANGKKHTYVVKCTYTDNNGVKRTKTSAKFYYYYLTRPSLTYYKNTSAGMIKLIWKQNTAASGYQIKYVTGSTTKTLTISGNKTVTKTLTRLKKGSTYKCYVRAYKTVSGKKYYSAWSSCKSVKVTK